MEEEQPDFGMYAKMHERMEGLKPMFEEWPPAGRVSENILRKL